MPSSDHLQYQQLSMFMPAKDLIDPEKTRHMDANGYDSVTDLFHTKLSEAKSHAYSQTIPFTLHQSIEIHGVREPVILSAAPSTSHLLPKPEDKELLINGHHRVAAADDINPDMFVPVTYFYPNV
jgi:hypothetical protein